MLNWLGIFLINLTDKKMLLMLFADCEDGLSRLPLVKIQHCFREANKRAYALTRRGAILSQERILLFS